MKDKLPITVAILLGGENSRFGSPKAFLPWNGRSMAAHLAGVAADWSSEVLFVGKKENQVPEDAKRLAGFVEDLTGFPGPLAGFAAAMARASRPWIFLTGVDMPFLNEKVLREFWNLREKSVLLDAIVPYTENRWQPLCALWNRHALKILQASPWTSFQKFLNEGGLQITRVDEKNLRSWDPDLLCLEGFNRQEDWERIRKLEPKHP